MIFADPPFFSVSLSMLFRALRVLSHFDFSQPIALSYLVRRAAAVEATFARFALKQTSFHPGYQTVKKIAKNDIAVFANCDVLANLTG